MDPRSTITAALQNDTTLRGYAPGIDCGERTTEQDHTTGLPALPTAIRRLLVPTQAPRTPSGSNLFISVLTFCALSLSSTSLHAHCQFENRRFCLAAGLVRY